MVPLGKRARALGGQFAARGRLGRGKYLLPSAVSHISLLARREIDLGTGAHQKLPRPRCLELDGGSIASGRHGPLYA